MKFIADTMLGRLSRYLRAAGHDVLYYRNIEDADLIARARQEERIILTRDSQIANRKIYQTKQPACIVLESQDYHKQLQQLKRTLNLSLNAEFCRCIQCNQYLEKVSKQDFKPRIPPYVYQNHHRFWYCSQCDKLYWRGTHCSSMEKVLASIS
ncbi:MAG: Mut7-C RNAse domain-containing protein [Actinomycetota bacterium]|nr:Mut7-C RNAse domain-containing protein [Actinomycetota bacterium]